MEQQEIFTDGISNIHLTGNLVRFDLISLQPQLKADNGQPVFQFSHRMIMPLEAFIQAFGLQENLVNQLIQAGVLKRNQPESNAITVRAEDQKQEAAEVAATVDKQDEDSDSLKN